MAIRVAETFTCEIHHFYNVIYSCIFISIFFLFNIHTETSMHGHDLSKISLKYRKYCSCEKASASALIKDLLQ
jgi:hypothetical protein